MDIIVYFVQSLYKRLTRRRDEVQTRADILAISTKRFFRKREKNLFELSDEEAFLERLNEKNHNAMLRIKKIKAAVLMRSYTVPIIFPTTIGEWIELFTQYCKVHLCYNLDEPLYAQEFLRILYVTKPIIVEYVSESFGMELIDKSYAQIIIDYFHLSHFPKFNQIPVLRNVIKEQCPVCFEDTDTMTDCKPKGHPLCLSCRKNLQRNKCPLCRQPIAANMSSKFYKAYERHTLQRFIDPGSRDLYM
jgi:Zinc finger, C3HC4 type (RING finger)